jgi:hypothetical protein
MGMGGGMGMGGAFGGGMFNVADEPAADNAAAPDADTTNARKKKLALAN